MRRTDQYGRLPEASGGFNTTSTASDRLNTTIAAAIPDLTASRIEWTSPLLAPAHPDTVRL